MITEFQFSGLLGEEMGLEAAGSACLHILSETSGGLAGVGGWEGMEVSVYSLPLRC